MPMLALGEAENGRSVALTVDGSWKLNFSSLAERTGGHAFPALWDGLLGWLMRDTRYELLQLGLESPCVSALPGETPGEKPVSVLRVRGAASPSDVELEVRPMGTASRPVAVGTPVVRGKDLLFTLPELPAGGYSARAKVRGGFVTTRDFACEVGGEEWADSRPDEARMKALAKATGGTFAKSLGDLVLPKPTVLTVEKQTSPVLPSWGWSLLAAVSLGIHWILRRATKLR
jgi:hypothetical protein